MIFFLFSYRSGRAYRRMQLESVQGLENTSPRLNAETEAISHRAAPRGAAPARRGDAALRRVDRENYRALNTRRRSSLIKRDDNWNKGGTHRSESEHARE